MKSAGRAATVCCAVVLAAVGGRIMLFRSAARADSVTSTTRKLVNLTIYSDDFGMVHEVRPQHMSKGDNHISVTDVSKQLDPQSVSLEWRGEGEQPQVVSQAYDLGITDGNDLTKRFLGREVELVRYGMNGYEAEHQKGVLMVQGQGGTVLKSNGNLYVNPQGSIVAPASAEIVTIPQLSVQADSPAAQSSDLDVSYLTRGISWSADYVANLSASDGKLSLECWATVLNKTGIDYPDAHVSLVTGSPNRAVKTAESRTFNTATASIPESEAKLAFNDGRASFGSAHGGFAAPVAVGEMHAYPVAKPTTVIQDQMNRILMLSSKSVDAVKDYNTRPPDIGVWDEEYYRGPARSSRKGTVAVSLTFYNTEKNGIGQPLPHGDIRLYERDADGSSAYVGAAAINDTPENERVDVTLANVFDLFTEWRTVKRERPAKHVLRKTVELKLHNEKASDVTLRVVQGFEGRIHMVQEPIKHSSLSASVVQWMVPLKAHNTRTFTFTVDLSV